MWFYWQERPPPGWELAQQKVIVIRKERRRRACTCVSVFTCSDINRNWWTVSKGLLLCPYFETVKRAWSKTWKHCTLAQHLLHLQHTNQITSKADRDPYYNSYRSVYIYTEYIKNMPIIVYHKSPLKLLLISATLKVIYFSGCENFWFNYQTTHWKVVGEIKERLLLICFLNRWIFGSFFCCCVFTFCELSQLRQMTS